MVPSLKLSPYVHFIEDHLIPHSVRYGMVHRLTGQVWVLSPHLRSLINDSNFEAVGPLLEKLRQRSFIVPYSEDPLAPFMEQYVVRPIQNPALAYRDADGQLVFVRTSMERFIFSPRKDELPIITEEVLSPFVAEIYSTADGSRTLAEIISGIDRVKAREALNFLTSPERQAIRLAPGPPQPSDTSAPYNSAPRSLFHSSRWSSSNHLPDFHEEGIADPSWEFNWIEPTINHAFRFPSEVFGGLDYASQFCLATLNPEVVPTLGSSSKLRLLEVGGGTGTFARSFIRQSSLPIDYHIVELSPVLAAAQEKLLSNQVTHFRQDATKLDLAGNKFDLILANEVIADFPAASVRREKNAADQVLVGDGAEDVIRYQLEIGDAPNEFLINSGVFRFLERAREHLDEKGLIVLVEYGAADMYPILQHYLNHDEVSIHFGHVATCAEQLGFKSRLMTLKEFLGFDDEVLILDGAAEQIFCLNHVFGKLGYSLPYAALSQAEFIERCGEKVERLGLIGHSFSPLRSGFHFGPPVNDFMALILNL